MEYSGSEVCRNKLRKSRYSFSQFVAHFRAESFMLQVHTIFQISRNYIANERNC